MIVTTINVNGMRAAVRERSPRTSACWPGCRRPAPTWCACRRRAPTTSSSPRRWPRRWPTAGTSPRPARISRAAAALPCCAGTPFTRCESACRQPNSSLHGRYLEADVGGHDRRQRVRPHRRGRDRPAAGEGTVHGRAGQADDRADAEGREAVVCGDWNIAHTEHDIKAWKANVKKAGFLPSERQWLTDLLDSGWVDVMRRLHPDGPGPYSWWSWRGKASTTTPAGASTTTWPANPGGPTVAARVEKPRRLCAALVGSRTGDRGIRLSPRGSLRGWGPRAPSGRPRWPGARRRTPAGPRSVPSSSRSPARLDT